MVVAAEGKDLSFYSPALSLNLATVFTAWCVFQDLQTMDHELKWPHHLFWRGTKAKNYFYIFKRLKRIPKKSGIL